MFPDLFQPEEPWRAMKEASSMKRPEVAEDAAIQAELVYQEKPHSKGSSLITPVPALHELIPCWAHQQRKNNTFFHQNSQIKSKPVVETK